MTEAVKIHRTKRPFDGKSVWFWQVQTPTGKKHEGTCLNLQSAMNAAYYWSKQP